MLTESRSLTACAVAFAFVAGIGVGYFLEHGATFDHAMTLIQTLGVVAGVALAVYGLRSWRHQIVGQGRFEAARAGMRAATMLRRRIYSARAGLSEALAKWDPGLERTAAVSTVASVLDGATIESEAASIEVSSVLGADAEKPLTALRIRAAFLVHFARYEAAGYVAVPGDPLARFTFKPSETEQVDERLLGEVRRTLESYLRR